MAISVLVLEDDQVIRSQLKTLIKDLIEKNHGMLSFVDEEPNWVECGSYGDTFQKNVEVNEFDLAIIDYELNSEGDGADAVKYISDILTGMWKTKIIFYTGTMSDPVDISKLFGSGIFSYVQKNSENEEGDSLIHIAIDRALESIEKDEYLKLSNKLVDRNIPTFLRDSTVYQRLEEGVEVKKGLLLCDLANSTVFFDWVRRNTGGTQIIRELIPDILGEQANIINDNEGIVDKFYGDEVRAYFGKAITNPGPEDARELCKNVLQAALAIIAYFQRRISYWVNEIDPDCGNRPNLVLFPRLFLNYAPVTWAIYGSRYHKDFTIWTENVAVLNRLKDKVRKIGTCGEGGRRDYEKAYGEIYITGSFYETLGPNAYRTCIHEDKEWEGYQQADMDDDERQRRMNQGHWILRGCSYRQVYSLQIPDSPICSECERNRREI